MDSDPQASPAMTFEDFLCHAREFATRIRDIKANWPSFPWYPYDSFANFDHVRKFSNRGREFISHIGPARKVLDIGVADGDTSFFLEHLGAEVTIIDNTATNFNDCRAILKLRAILSSASNLNFIDLEWTPWINGQYDIAFFWGILYHLRNPGLVLNTLAHCASRLLLSTMVFFTLENGHNVENQQLAYFVDQREINDDPTNYWLFTPCALHVLLKRSGWKVLDEFFVGDVSVATPKTGDCRIFVYCERVPNWAQLRIHHDF
jgi:tRNA (mo5U34)-methyltransferase